MSEGVLIAVSGFSGAGKGTIMKRLMEKYHIETSQVYRIKDEALYYFTVTMYGIMEC